MKKQNNTVAKKHTWAIEKAAQLWCKPQHSSKVMDPDFAYSIALELIAAKKAGAKEAA